MEGNACQAAGHSQGERKGGFQADELFILNLIQSSTSLLHTYRGGEKERQWKVTEHLLCARPVGGASQCPLETLFSDLK